LQPFNFGQSLRQFLERMSLFAQALREPLELRLLLHDGHLPGDLRSPLLEAANPLVPFHPGSIDSVGAIGAILLISDYSSR
jgi:hypothetical protein